MKARRNFGVVSSWGYSVIKSELVQRMAARNPHLYQRDIENIIDAILGEIANALAAASASNCAVSARSRLRSVRLEPAAIRAPATRCRSPRSSRRSSRPARKCASASIEARSSGFRSFAQPLGHAPGRARRVGRMELTWLGS